jgi:Uma2 family endonuclease
MTGDKLWTWEDIVHLPEHEQPEIVGGKPYYRAGPRNHHGRTLARLTAKVVAADSPGLLDGWWICGEATVRLTPHQIVCPDLVGWRRSRLPELPNDWPCDIRPDWVCEVLSPSNAWYDRGPKAQAYAEAGIPWYWLVDPVERTVEVYEQRGGQWSLLGCHTDGALLPLPPFDDLQVAVGDLFVPLPQMG